MGFMGRAGPVVSRGGVVVDAFDDIVLDIGHFFFGLEINNLES